MSRRTRRRLRRARPLLWVVLLGSGLLLVGGSVVGVQALQARHDLLQARSSIVAAHQAVSDGDQVRARASLETARTQAQRAHGRITSWVWGAYGRLPLAGPTVREARGLIEITDAVTTEVLAPLVAAAPGSASWSGKADLAALTRTAGPLATADTRLGEARVRLAALPVSRVGVLGRARSDLTRAVVSLAADVRDAAVAAKALPPLLGSERPSRLLVVTQNLAEERATGGLVGAYALLSVDDGRITLERSGTNADLVDAAGPVVDLGKDFEARYGVSRAASTWRSANLTPDVPTAASILAGLSARQLRAPVDGVIFVDPVALAHVLRATGPVTVPLLGALSADNAVPLLLSDVYKRFPSPASQPLREEALRQALDTVVTRLQSSVSGRLARELARAVATGHVQVYATANAVEQELLRSRVSGKLPASGPFLSLVTQDVGGSKLGYYLHREVTYEATPSPVAVSLGAGPETVETGTVTVRLRNAAPASGLPAYVTTRADDPRARPVGQLKTWVSVYLGPRSAYSSATVDGRRVTLASEVENGLSVFSTHLTIDPGQTVTLVLTMSQPAGPGSTLVWRQQPRLRPDLVVVRRTGGYASFHDVG